MAEIIMHRNIVVGISDSGSGAKLPHNNTKLPHNNTKLPHNERFTLAAMNYFMAEISTHRSFFVGISDSGSGAKLPHNNTKLPHNNTKLPHNRTKLPHNNRRASESATLGQQCKLSQYSRV